LYLLPYPLPARRAPVALRDPRAVPPGIPRSGAPANRRTGAPESAEPVRRVRGTDRSGR